jgi:hypothetical protein
MKLRMTMSFSKLEKPKTLAVTRQLVNEFLNMEALPRDRPLSERRLAFYRKQLAEGSFRPVTWASAYCEETDTIYRVNGKHTSTLLSGIDPLPKDFYVTVERYSCLLLEDVAMLWATFDSSVATRTGNEIIASFASTVPEFVGVKQKTLSLSVFAASYQKWDIDFYNESRVAERAELLLDHVDFVLWLDTLLFPKDGNVGRAKHLRRGPVVAAILGTRLSSEESSDAFWRHVRDEDQAQGLPTRVLAKWLSEVTFKNHHAGKAGKKVVLFREMFVRCLHAWNAWRTNTRTNLKYHPNAPIPVIR